MTPTFSVIVPAYNAARTIRATLRSVLQQTREDFEIVVVDDGSVDETIARATELGDARITVQRQQHRGPSAARNLGISETTGAYVCPLDADDLLLPTFLERMAATLEGDEGAGFAYTDAWTLDDASGRIRRASAKAHQRPPRPSPSDPTAFLEILLDRNFVYGCTLIRRSVLEELGGYDEELSCAEDYELWLRIVGNGYRAAHFDGRLAVYREGQTASNSGDELRMARAQIAAYERVATAYPAPERIRAAARAKADGWRVVEERLAAPRPTRDAPDVAGLARALGRRALGPLRWYGARPAEIELLLDATDGWPPRDVAGAPLS